MTRMLQGEILAPVEHLHRRFDAAYDQVELLSEQIDQHRAVGADCRLLVRRAIGPGELACWNDCGFVEFLP